jgi:hypothetical protein
VWCIGGLVLLGCSRDKEQAERAETPTPFVATATAGGIARPPLTPQSTEPPRQRTRAEAFLRRIAPTPADLPPSFAEPQTALRDADQLAASQPDPTAAKAQWDRAGLVLSYESRSENGQAEAPGPDGAVREVTHTAYAFGTTDGAGLIFGEWAAELPATARALIQGQSDEVQVDAVDNLGLGESVAAERATGRSSDSPNNEIVGWAIAVRRGAGGFLLTLHGSGSAVDTLARELAQRLDQRLGAAIPASWP